MLHHSGICVNRAPGMDQQAVAFTPTNDIWRLHGEMLRVQQTQVDHAERLARLERRQDEDARVKSVWGTSSPFPSVLGGTPQQVPLQHPPSEPFSNFDDNQGNLIGSLHLDADDEPRRTGATSRANSVRFDETANRGWEHSSRASIDLIPRTGSGLGGHPMSERTYSHKSDGRQSSAGHSVHSATSGRANSMGIDITFGANHSNHSPYETPALAPGLFILGSVPAIIRCWLNTNFKHDSLLYAAVCTGSYTSFLDSRLVDQLGFHGEVEENDEGVRKIELALYLPEAIPHPASSRSASPAPQLPSFRVMFTVVDRDEAEPDEKAIQVFLGSDVLRAHNADILFSSNTLVMFDDDRSKLSIPLVRPENERSFKSLYITSGPLTRFVTSHSAPEPTSLDEAAEQELLKEPPAPLLPDTEQDMAGGSSDDGTSGTPASSSRPSLEHHPVPGTLHAATDAKEAGDTNAASSSGSFPRSGSSPAIWSNWRRESSEKQTAMDWSNATKGPSQTYQRKETGIKVLKPSKSTSRAVSSASVAAASPSASQSRFFDDGKRRVMATAAEGPAPQASASMPVAVESKARPASKERQASISKPKTTNPIGGASAFSWLNSAGQAK